MEKLDRLHRRMRWAMTQAGLSQAAVANHLGITRAAVNLWLTEDDTKRTTPDDGTLQQLAKLTGVDYEWLTQGLGQPTDARGVQEHTLPTYLTTNVHRLRHGHSRLSEWRKSIQSVLRSKVDYIDRVNIRVRDRRHDYVSNHLVLDTLYRPGHDRSELAAALWELYMSRFLEQRLGVRRAYLLAVRTADEGVPPDYVEAAAAVGILVYEVDAPDDVVQLVEDHEPP